MKRLLLAATLSACGVDADELWQELSSPGDLPVGFLQLDHTYDPVGEGTVRTLPLSVWYPAVDGGEEAATYAVAGIVSLPSEVALDAPEPIDGDHPVLIYSHGSGGEGLLAYPYAEHFASHGWVVVAPNHVGNTILDDFLGTRDPFATIMVNRPADISEALDAVELHPVIGPLVGGDALLFGHSFGGYTTLKAGGAVIDVDALLAECDASPGEDDGSCALWATDAYQEALTAGPAAVDPRIVAIAPQAPALYPFWDDAGLTALDVPVLLMSGERDQTTTHEGEALPAWGDLSTVEGNHWINIPDGGHLTFLTVCDDLDLDLSAFWPGADEDGCGDDFISSTRAVEGMSAYLLAWGNLHVRGDDVYETIYTMDSFVDGFEVRSAAP